MGVRKVEWHDLSAFYEMLSGSFGVLSQNTGFYPSLDRIIETTLGPLNLGPGGGSYNEPISRLHRVAHMITIDQWQYIWKILEHFGLENSWSVSTPMAINIKLPKLETPEVDQRLYQSMLGSLMYAVIRTWPNIMFAVHYLSQFLVAPGLEHIVALKHIYQYLNGTWDLGMTFHGNWIRDDIIGFTDSDWAGDANSRCKRLNSELGAQTALHLSVSKGVIQRKRESRSSATSSSNDNSRPGPMAQADHTGMKYVLFT